MCARSHASPVTTTRSCTSTTRTASVSWVSGIAAELCDWGTRGNGIVRHHGESYDNVILVAGF